MKACAKKLFFLFFLASLLLAGGCQAVLPSPKFDVAFSTPKNEPVYIEDAVYDDAWIGHGGIMLCCWKDAGRINVIGDRPVPKMVFIRWFNYKQQKYYEATVLLPENLKSIMWKLPEPRFGGRILTTGVLPNGEVVVWASNGLDERMGTWVEVARTKGHVATGDPHNHRSQTEEMKERGEI